MSKRIGVVTGGGDCPGLNAVIRAVAKASAKRGWECIGVLGGYEGLLEPRRTIPLDYQILSGLLTRGGTILGTANRGRFSAKVGHGEARQLPKELLEATKAGMRSEERRVGKECRSRGSPEHEKNKNSRSEGAEAVETDEVC